MNLARILPRWLYNPTPKTPKLTKRERDAYNSAAHHYYLESFFTKDEIWRTPSQERINQMRDHAMSFGDPLWRNAYLSIVDFYQRKRTREDESNAKMRQREIDARELVRRNPPR